MEPTPLAEFGTLDMTEATGYLKTLQLEANQGRCSNCGQPGHRASSCAEPRAPRCLLCRTVGHLKQNCEFATCQKCNKTGHTVAVYDMPDLRPCANCGKVGHSKKDCTERRRIKLKWSVPSVARKENWKATYPALDDVAQEDEAAATEEEVNAVPDAWARVTAVGANDVDAKQLAKEIAEEEENPAEPAVEDGAANTSSTTEAVPCSLPSAIMAYSQISPRGLSQQGGQILTKGEEVDVWLRS